MAVFFLNMVPTHRVLAEASSWPYNPTILRTLIFGVLVPITTVLARRVVEVYIR